MSPKIAASQNIVYICVGVNDFPLGGVLFSVGSFGADLPGISVPVENVQWHLRAFRSLRLGACLVFLTFDVVSALQEEPNAVVAILPSF